VRPRITLIRAALPVKCPSCGQEISWERVTADAEFLCSQCGHGVRIRIRYFYVLRAFSLLFSGFAAHLLALRGIAFLTVTVILVFPIQFALAFVTLRLFPPDVEATGEFRGILYDSVADVTPTPAAAESESSGNAPAIFHARRERRSLEGAAIFMFFGVIALAMGWSVIEPAVHRTWPEWRSARQGPSGFPVAVKIKPDRLSLTNPSTDRWTCRAELGVGSPYASTFVAGAQQTADALYGDFRSTGHGIGGNDLWQLAREKITLTCDEDSGRSHYLSF
jgi:predicted RNA-binding Zn-ribbon protein involved in translation (DUF1610 family)